MIGMRSVQTLIAFIKRWFRQSDRFTDREDERSLRNTEGKTPVDEVVHPMVGYNVETGQYFTLGTWESPQVYNNITTFNALATFLAGLDADNIHADHIHARETLEIVTTASALIGRILQDGNNLIHTYPGTGLADNLFIGPNSGNFTLTTAYRNMGIGPDTLSNLTTGNRNVALNWGALRDCQGGFLNFAGGQAALLRLTSGFNCVALGGDAATECRTANNIVAIGAEALRSNQSAIGSVAIGGRSLRNLLGKECVGIGYLVGRTMGNEENNTMVGARSGELATVSGAVFLGHSAGQNETVDNLLYIHNTNSASPLIWGDFANRLLRFNGDIGFDPGHGLRYGSFYGNNIGFRSVAFGGGGTYVIVSDANITGGRVNDTTFQNDQELLIAVAGDYSVVWDMSAEAAGVNKHVEAGLGIGGAIQAPGRNHIETKFANEEEAFGGNTILALVAGDTLSVMITNEDDNTQVTVHHINLTATLIGG